MLESSIWAFCYGLVTGCFIGFSVSFLIISVLESVYADDNANYDDTFKDDM